MPLTVRSTLNGRFSTLWVAGFLSGEAATGFLSGASPIRRLEGAWVRITPTNNANATRQAMALGLVMGRTLGWRKWDRLGALPRKAKGSTPRLYAGPARLQVSSGSCGWGRQAQRHLVSGDDAHAAAAQLAEHL